MKEREKRKNDKKRDFGSQRESNLKERKLRRGKLKETGKKGETEANDDCYFSFMSVVVGRW